MVTDYGFESIEVFATANGKHFDVNDPALVEETGRMLRDLGITNVSVHAPKVGVDLSSPYDEERRTAIELVMRTIDVATLLAASSVTVHPSSIEGEESDRDRRWPMFRHSIKELCAYAAGRDVLIAVENHPFPLFGSNPVEISRHLSELRVDNAGICLDLAHAYVDKHPLEEVIQQVAPNLISVQASDNRGHTDEHLLPGKGFLPWADILDALELVRYRGPLVMEVRDGRPLCAVLEDLVDFSIKMGLNEIGQLSY